MCKLCNTDRRAYTHSRALKEETLKFIQIAKTYTGEFPCKSCMQNYLKVLDRGATNSIDTYVIRTLLRSYSKGFSATDKNKAKARYYSKVKTPSISLERVEKNISKVTNNDTGTIRYRVEKKIKGKLYVKHFSNTVSARKHRDMLNQKEKDKLCQKV